MTALCFNTMNRSAFFLGDEDPDLPAQVDAAAKAGFRLFGPDSFSIGAFLERGGTLEALAARLEGAGMRAFELPTLMIDRDLEQVRQDIETMLPMAEALRPDWIQINVGCEVDDAILAVTREAAERFGALGAGFAVEYLPWLPELSSLAATRRFMDRVGDARVRALVDTWHFFHGDDTWDELVALPLEELAYLQFDDHPPLAGDDLVAETVGRRVMPGDGVFELERFCDVFRDKGFDGVVSCEILSEETRRMDPGEFARRVYESCSRYWP